MTESMNRPDISGDFFCLSQSASADLLIGDKMSFQIPSVEYFQLAPVTGDC